MVGRDESTRLTGILVETGTGIIALTIVDLVHGGREHVTTPTVGPSIQTHDGLGDVHTGRLTVARRLKGPRAKIGKSLGRGETAGVGESLEACFGGGHDDGDGNGDRPCPDQEDRPRRHGNAIHGEGPETEIKVDRGRGRVVTSTAHAPGR